MSGKFSASQDNKNVFEDIQRNLRDGDSRKLLEAAGTASQQARQTPDGLSICLSEPCGIVDLV